MSNNRGLETHQVASCLDELSKLGHGHGGIADIATEALGIPGALAVGGRKAGAGALGGFGVGMLGRHVFNKATEHSNFFRNHPVLRQGLAAAALAAPSAMGATAAPHLIDTLRGLKTAGIQGAIAKYMATKAAKQPLLAVHALDELDNYPARVAKYEEMLRE